MKRKKLSLHVNTSAVSSNVEGADSLARGVWEAEHSFRGLTEYSVTDSRGDVILSMVLRTDLAKQGLDVLSWLWQMIDSWEPEGPRRVT